MDPNATCRSELNRNALLNKNNELTLFSNAVYRILHDISQSLVTRVVLFLLVKFFFLK